MVTVIGLGAMGRALAGAFLDRQHATTVWNRSAEKADDLRDRGAVPAATVAEAVAASPVLVVCLLNYDTVHQVLDPVAGSLAGRTIVNLTNGTPAQAREMAEWAAGCGADYLDGGIMAVPQMIGGPAGFILYSGSSTAFKEYEPVLAGLATPRYVGEEPGAAALYDLALLSAMYGMFGGFFHAAALMGSGNVPLTDFAPLAVSWLTAMTSRLPAMAAPPASTPSSTLEMQATGYVNLIDASREQGVSTLLVEPMQALLNRGVAAGLGEADVSALINLLYAGNHR